MTRLSGTGSGWPWSWTEAHDIPPKVLIALKRLWDSAMLYKLLAIILVGQGGERFDGKPWGLKDKILRSADLREFAERCILVGHADPQERPFQGLPGLAAGPGGRGGGQDL